MKFPPNKICLLCGRRGEISCEIQVHMKFPPKKICLLCGEGGNFMWTQRIMNSIERNFINRVTFHCLGPFRFIKVTFKSTRHIQMSPFWIFCNFIGYFVHSTCFIIFWIKLCKNLHAKFEIRLRFLFRN